MSDQRIYEEFKKAIDERRDRELKEVNERYQRDLADLNRLWGVVSANIDQPRHPGTVRATLRLHVREIVADLPLNTETSAPHVTELLGERYPERRQVAGTLVSRELRKLEKSGVLRLIRPAHSSQPNVYSKVGKIADPTSRKKDRTAGIHRAKEIST